MSDRFSTFRAGYQLGPRHRVSGDIGGGVGSFYGGSVREATFRGRLDVARRLTLEPNVSLNWIDVPSEPEPFWVNVLALRATWPFSPRASLGTLVQYETDGGSLGASARFRWEYRPGSDLFIVLSEGRGTELPGTPMLTRSVAVKVTRLLPF